MVLPDLLTVSSQEYSENVVLNLLDSKFFLHLKDIAGARLGCPARELIEEDDIEEVAQRTEVPNTAEEACQGAGRPIPPGGHPLANYEQVSGKSDTRGEEEEAGDSDSELADSQSVTGNTNTCGSSPRRASRQRSIPS